ncbi:glycine/D-amino acid oxidase-like deaminating enzyme [Tenacibaculum gallaicum]|uniref:Glycine/D-amino acid oxidase-like deaminating enzyme n=1 Tax=Tenacibaculum gallaicum TaxID=561505 RepID=A0A3E0I721_9FLAO|nr:FAD-dependent oxidoreductase [Tenacibaculum gallaicum]REH54532.1 glycine/D-amino acid oxidase-like deaminating enzyme [Tenacibaculum gallaicum]
MNAEVDYIIVGLGLSGIAFTEQLIKNNKSFIVFENNSQVSSVVAGGVYNPVILKRFTPVWNGHEQLQKAIPFYKELEEKLQLTLDYKFSTKKVFTSVGDENNWFIAYDKPMLSYYMNPEISKERIKGIIGDYGFGELKGTGRIDTPLLVKTYKEYIKSLKSLVKEAFDYSKVKIEKEIVTYEDITAKRIVFSEGFGLKKNPFFNYLPLNGTKGETITIHAPELKIDFLLKGSVFIMPLGNDTYKIGATFNWTDKTSIPTEEGRKELEDKLQKVISVPYTIIEQSAGIRPTVKDRRPLVGKHPKYPKLAVLNGLGTRGVMVAPTVAENLFNHLESNEELDKEIDIERFRQE